MSDREDINDCQTKQWYDFNASTSSVGDETESMYCNDNQSYCMPSPPTDFILNFQKCMNLFGIRSHSHRYSPPNQMQTKYVSKNGRPPKGIDGQLTPRLKRGKKTDSECCSSNLDGDNGEGDVATNDCSEGNTPSKTGLNCVKCGKTYSKGQYVRDHFRTVHRKSIQNYSCRVCGQTFSWRVTALKHIKKSHPEKKTSLMVEILY